MPTDVLYPHKSQLQHGDILLPRRLDVDAICTYTDAVTDLVDASPTDELPLWTPPKAGERPDLIRYWPYLLRNLKELRDSKSPLALLIFTSKVQNELGSELNLDDAAQAILAKQYVGHCAIVDFPYGSDEPWIIEASHTVGRVHTQSYEQWKEERRQANAAIWIYRMDALHENDLADKFVNAAHQLRMQGICYGIFDSKTDQAKMTLDMTDVSAIGDSPYLYCSELLWVCAQHCGITFTPPKGDHTFPMFSPKDFTLCQYAVNGGAPRDLTIVNMPNLTPYRPTTPSIPQDVASTLKSLQTESSH